MKSQGGPAVFGRRDAVPGPEGSGEVCRATKSPAGGDLSDGEMAEPLIGEVGPAPPQPLLADPLAEREALAPEEPVQLPDRDKAGLGDRLGG